MEFRDFKYIIKHAPLFQNKSNDYSKDWYYFNHIPKTGGTSLLYSIYDYFNPNNIYPNAWEYFIKQKGKYIPLTEFKKRKDVVTPNKQIVIGHFKSWPLNNLREQSPKVICFIRNPVKRVMSSIEYHQKRNRRYKGKSKDEILHTFLNHESNLQARYLGFRPQKKNYAQTIENLKNIDALCITENFKQSIELINSSFNWNLHSNYIKNKSKNKQSTWSENQKNKIKSNCSFELELYEMAKEKFQHSCKQYNL